MSGNLWSVQIPVQQNPVNVELISDIETKLTELREILHQHNEAVRTQLDGVRETAFPEYVPTPENPAVICSIIQNSQFVQTSKQIDDFLATLCALKNSVTSGSY